MILSSAGMKAPVGVCSPDRCEPVREVTGAAAVIEAHGDINLVYRSAERSADQLKADIHFRKSRLECRQSRHEPVHGEGRGYGEYDGLHSRPARLLHPEDRPLDLVEAARNPREERASLLCQDGARSRAMEKRDAQMRLQPPDRAADGRAGHA
jgi:hypothetical protein